MLITLAGRLAQFALMFVNIKVMTSFLEPAQYGVMSLYLAINLFFGFVFVNPVGTYINRHLRLWQGEGQLRAMFRLFLPYWSMLAVACFIGLMTAQATGLLFENESLWALFVCSALVLSSTLFNTLVPSLNLLGHDKSFVVLTVVTSLFGLLLSSLAVFVFDPSAGNWLAGLVLGQVCGVGLSFLVYRRLGLNTGSSPTQPVFQVLSKSVFPYAWPVLLYTVLIWTSFQAYRFVIEEYFSLVELGLVVAGYSVAIQIIAATEQIANTWFLPRFYSECDSSNPTVQSLAIARYVCSMAAPVVLALFAVLTGADLLIKAMLGAAYQDTAIYLLLGVFIEVFRVVANATGLRFHQTRQTTRLIWPAFFALLLIIVLCIVQNLTLYSVMLSMIAGSVFLLLFMFDRVLLANMLVIIKDQFSVRHFCLPVMVFLGLVLIKPYLSFYQYAAAWVVLWAMVGISYLGSVLKHAKQQ